MEYFCFFHSYRKKTERLSDQELGRLVRALCVYSETGERQELTGRESLAFDFMAEDIDRSKAAYRRKCETNRQNVQQRYTTATTVYDGYDRIRESTESTKDKDKPKQKAKPKQNESITGEIVADATDAPAHAQEQRRPFAPPTVDEVAAYCAQEGYRIDAEKFVAFYSRSGWKLHSGLAVTDWRACVRYWARQDAEREPPPDERGDEYYAELRACAGRAAET